MHLEQNKEYRIIKEGVVLIGLPNSKGLQQEIKLELGTVLKYVGEDYKGIDYDIIKPPYFRYQNKDYVFQPSSFSGLIPSGYLEKVEDIT